MAYSWIQFWYQECYSIWVWAQCVFVSVCMYSKYTLTSGIIAIHDKVEKQISLIPRSFQTLLSLLEVSLYNLGSLSHFSWQIISSTIRLDERLWTAIFRSLHWCSLAIRSGLWLGPLKDSQRVVLKQLLRALKNSFIPLPWSKPNHSFIKEVYTEFWRLCGLAFLMKCKRNYGDKPVYRGVCLNSA